MSLERSDGLISAQVTRPTPNRVLMPQSHCRESTGDPVRVLAICAIRMWVRNIENKNVPDVKNLLNNEPTRINTVQIANDGEPSRTNNDKLEPIQIRTGWHELIRNVVRINMTQVECNSGQCKLIRLIFKNILLSFEVNPIKFIQLEFC